jgi:hypothetical protein
MVKTTGIGMEKSLAFEVVGGRLKVKLEESVPTVRFMGETYAVTESPSVTVRGKKYFVDDIG